MCYPALEAVLRLPATKPLRHVTRQAARCFEDTQLHQGVERLERVMEKTSFVIDPGQPVHHFVIVPDYLEPEFIYPGVAAKKPVRPEIHFLIPQIDGAG